MRCSHPGAHSPIRILTRDRAPVMNRLHLLLAITALVLGGCGSEAEPAEETAEGGAGLPVYPWDTLPPESIYGATPVENLRVTPVELHVLGIPPGWDGMRIAAISDLQLDLWSGNREVAAAAIRRAVAEQPDVVVLLGDYLGNGTDPTALRELLRPLSGVSTFAVLGDRDVRSDSLAARIAATLSEAGVRVLRNETAILEHGGDSAAVVGVDAELLGESVGEQAYVLGQLGSGTRVGFLISHNPVLGARADNDRVPAVLAGGVFCGDVEVPGTPRLSWLNSEAIPSAVVEGAERLYRIGQMVMFVTCGTGYGFIPVRFGAPPEVAIVTLRSVEAETAGEDARDAAVDTLLEQYESSLEDTTSN